VRSTTPLAKNFLKFRDAKRIGRFQQTKKIVLAMDWPALFFPEDSFTSGLLGLSWSTVSSLLQEAPIIEGTVPFHLIEEADDEPHENDKRRELDKDFEEEGYEEENEENESGENSADENDYCDRRSLSKRSRKEGKMLDITHLLCLLQSDAALAVNMNVSTFCKRWKEAVGQRKWPFRVLARLDKEIAFLKKKTPLSRGAEAKIAALRKQRKEALAPTLIRVTEF
jgi:hypothetical protein